MNQVEKQKAQLWEIYEVDDFIDAKDNQGDWRVGYIIDKNALNKGFKVRFDGWPGKYDEFYKFTSAKLSEFRSIIIGYTGQKQNPAIRTGWKFTRQYHNERLTKLKQYLIDPSKHSAHATNQLLRGHNYLYTDFLMTCTIPSEQSLNEVLQFFKFNIVFVCSYLKNYDTSFSQFYKSIEIASESHLINPQSAYIWSFYEILDTAYIITGSYNRLVGFFKQNADNLRKVLNIPQTANVKRAYQFAMVRQFILNDGLAIIKQILQQKLPQTKCLIPFLFLKSLTQLYRGICNVLTTTEKQSLMPQFIQITKRNLQKLGDKELKDLHKSNVVQLLDSLCQLYEGSANQREIIEWATNSELSLCLKMIKCPYFQKKLKGINGLIELIQRKKNIIDDEYLMKWFEKNKLFQNLFIENDNPQLIKKSAEFARHLHNTETLPNQIIFLIWQSRVGKHQTSLQEIYDFISGVPLRTKDDNLTLQVFKAIASVEEKEWDQDYIKLVKDYTINALGLLLPDSSIPHSYGYQILYKQLLRKQDDKTFNNFIIVLQRFQKTQFLMDFVLKCFKNLQIDNKSDIHVSILLRVIREQLVVLNKLQINIIDILINDLLRSSQCQTKKLQERFELFSTALKITQSYVGLEEFKNLWNTYLYSPGRKCFLDWALKKKQDGKHSINQKIFTQDRAKIFEELWPLIDTNKFKKMAQDQALFFAELFKSSNWAHGSLKRSNGIIFVDNMNFIGYQKISKAFIETQNSEVAQMIADLIVLLHMNLEPQLQQQKEQIIRKILQTMRNRMKQCLKTKDFWSIKKQLMIAQKLILREDEIFPINAHSSKFVIYKQLTVVNKQTGEEKIFKFNVSSSFYEFKKEVAEQFKITIKSCKLYAKGDQIQITSYFKSLQECNFGNVFELEQSNEQYSMIKNILNQMLEELFELLGESQIEKDVWKIVSQLPLSQSSLVKVEKSRYPWAQISNQSIYRQLYMFKVVQNMDQNWWQIFVKEGGINFIVQKVNKSQFKTQTEREYLLILVTIISKGLQIKGVQIKKQVFLIVLKALERMLNCIKQLQESKLEQKIVQKIFEIGDQISQINNPIEEVVNQMDSAVQFLKLGLIVVNSQNLRRLFLNRLICFYQLKPITNQNLLNLTLNNLLQFAISYGKTQKLNEYFQFTSQLLKKINNQQIKKYINQKNQFLISKLFKLCQQQDNEENIEKVNHLLEGYLILITNLIKLGSSKQKQQILNFILYDCLFSSQKTKCKSRNTRFASLEVLRNLLKQESIMKIILTFLTNYHTHGFWRSRRIDDWSVTESDKLKSSTGYAGLKNLGCICYMNSFIQQIYMIPKFRQSILECQNIHYNPKQENDDLLHQLKKMFLNLSYSDKRFYNPKDFCFAFKDYEGRPTNVHEQMDIDQFSGILFDRIENQIKQTEHSAIVKSLFGGVFSNEIVCKGCPHFSETQQSFLSIGLTVKSKRDIYQSLDAMIKGDNLEGQNAYFCERCNKKVAAVKRVCLKKLPDHLIIALKRFQFDYETMTKLKINDYCQFPIELNLKEYSQQYLRRKEKPNHLDEQDMRSDQYFQYTLKGVAIHLGHADSGHYYSFIQERKQNGNWLQFNDTSVKHFDIRRLPEEAFGGQISHLDLKEKIKNAYLLIYDRNIQITPKPKDPQPNFLSLPVYSDIRNNLIQENKLQKIESILFSDQYVKFINLLLDDLENNENHNADDILKFSITAYLTIIIRFKDQTSTFSIMKKMKPLIQNHPNVIEWILAAFSSPTLLEEFFKNNPSKDIRRLLANWLGSVCIQSSFESQKLFCNCLLYYITTINESPIDICVIIYLIIRQQKICDHLVTQGVVGRLMQNLIRKEKRKFSSLQQLMLIKDESPLGKEIFVEKSQFQLTRKPKTDTQNGYLWAIVVEIIKMSERKKISLNNYLGNIQSQYIHIPNPKIYKILEQCKNKFHINKFCQYLCFLSFKHQKTTDELLHLIYRGIKQFQSKRYRQFFVLFKRLIRIKDELESKRVQGYRNIIKALRQNQKYLFDCDIIHQWAIKLIRKSPLLQQQIRKDEETIKYLVTLASKKVPSDQSIRKNSTYTETTVNKLHGIRLPKSKKGYSQLSKQKEQFFLLLIKKAEIPADPWESDDDLSQIEINEGSIVSYFNYRENLEFIDAKVQEYFLGRLCIAPKRMKTIQIWKDDELLTMPHKVQQQSPSSHPNSDKTTQMDPDQQEQFLSDSQ